MKTIFLIGMMGSGKSTVGQELAKSTHLKYVDMDTQLEKKMGMTVSEIFQSYGESQFRLMEKALLKELLNQDFDLVSTGGGVVLDEENRTMLKDMGVCVFLNGSVETLAKRLENDASRPLLKTTSLEDLYQTRSPLYEGLSDFTVLTDNRTIEEIVSIIIEVLNEYSFN